MKVFEGRVPRLPVVGRIRLGVFEKGYPQASDVLIFTAKVPDTLAPLADMYGGEVKAYMPQKSKQQEYRLISTSDSMEVWFPFPNADENVVQSYELWKHTGLQRRCDGYMAQVNELDTETGEIETVERPCICAENSQECETTTTLRFFLPQTPGLGMWELKTTSRHVLYEIHDTIRFLASRFEGQMHRLPLRLAYSPKAMKYFDDKARKMKRVTKRIPTLNLAKPYVEVLTQLRELPGMSEEMKAIESMAQSSGGGGQLPPGDAPTRTTLRQLVEDVAPVGQKKKAVDHAINYMVDVLEIDVDERGRPKWEQVDPKDWDAVQDYVREQMWPPEGEQAAMEEE
jgi:hypothetical protein